MQTKHSNIFSLKIVSRVLKLAKSIFVLQTRHSTLTLKQERETFSIFELHKAILCMLGTQTTDVFGIQRVEMGLVVERVLVPLPDEVLG